MKLPDNYKGKTFADISKEIQEKYKDRHDAISKKGMMAELKALKEAQEKVRFDKQVEDTVGSIKKMQTGSFVNDPLFSNFGQALDSYNNPPFSTLDFLGDYNYGDTTPTPSQGTTAFDNTPPTKTNIPTLDLQSIGLNLANGVNAAPTELMSNPNQPFGDPNNSVGITNDGPTSTAPTGGGNLDLGKYAGLAMNLASLMGMDKPEDIYDTLSARGIDTRMDTPDLVAPEQTYYSKIDFAPIQRAIEQQAANFKSNNLNASNGNAGRFLSNELLSDVNTKRAVAEARMQEQIQNNQIAGMNAQERAKYVEALNQQELARQGTDQYNIGLGLQLEDINARNLGAYNTAKSQAKNMIASNFQDMQKEKMLSDAVTNALGYTPSGNYQVDPNQWANFMQNISQFLGK